MTREELRRRIAEILVESFELDAASITPEARLFEDLDLDSIDAIDLSVSAQELAGRRMTDDEVRALRTVADVVELVWRLRAERGLA